MNWRGRLCTSTPIFRKLVLSLDTSCFSNASTPTAIAEFERALALNPNYRYALAFLYTGEPARAIEVLQANKRLDPFQGPLQSPGIMGSANYMLKRDGETVHLFRECISRVPNSQFAYLGLAAAYAQLGQLDEARAEAAEVVRINPGFTIERHKHLLVHKDPEDVEHRIDGMRKAGCRSVSNGRLPRISHGYRSKSLRAGCWRHYSIDYQKARSASGHWTKPLWR